MGQSMSLLSPSVQKLGQSKNITNGLKSSLGHTLSNTTWHMDKMAAV